MSSPAYSRKEIIIFGVMMGFLLAAIGSWEVWRDDFVWSAPRIALLCLGGLIFIGGIFSARTVLPILDLWMTLTKALSHFVTFILLCLVYGSILCPIALFRRLFGADSMGQKKIANDKSYWRKPDAEERGKRAFEQQF
jgi:hypothetical protein